MKAGADCRHVYSKAETGWQRDGVTGFITGVSLFCGVSEQQILIASLPASLQMMFRQAGRNVFDAGGTLVCF